MAGLPQPPATTPPSSNSKDGIDEEDVSKEAASPSTSSASPLPSSRKPPIDDSPRKANITIIPHFLRLDSSASKWAHKLNSFASNHLNFFRIHVLVFTFVPLIAAGIFYASNGDTHIEFIDCLFLCVSAMTCTGLVSINVSTSTDWQQAILFFLMCVGNISAVSVTMVWIRRHFFRTKFDALIATSAKARKAANDVEMAEMRRKARLAYRLKKIVGFDRAKGRGDDPDDLGRTGSSDTASSFPHLHTTTSGGSVAEKERGFLSRKKTKGRKGPLRADMIRRMEGPAVLVNQTGAPSRAVPSRESGQRSRRGSAGSASQQKDGGILQDAEKSGGQGQSGADAHITLPQEEPPLEEAPRISESPRQMSRHEMSGHVTDGSEAEEASAGGTTPTDNVMSSSPPTRTRFNEPLIGANRMRNRQGSDPEVRTHSRRGSESGTANPRFSLAAASRSNDPFPRTQTVEFAEPSRARFNDRNDRAATSSMLPSVGANTGNVRHRSNTTFERTMTGRSAASFGSRSRGIPLTRTATNSKQRGFGGFPTPLDLASTAFEKAFPALQDRFTRTTSMARTSTITSIQSTGMNAGASELTGRTAPYLSFDATVSRNSRFIALTEAQRDELGGVEYRAIDLLAKLIPAYWLLVNFFCITLVAPWLASAAASKYHLVFEAQGSTKPSYTWFWFFQVVSAYTNTGMSLIDTSMINMNDAYFMLIPMGFLILAGNTGFPIFLRLFIWIISKCVPRESKVYETLRFLLDHPRRCFVYLFPSGQTWVLLLVLIFLNVTDWIAFLVLDIGSSILDMIKLDIRVFDGLFQSIAVRAAGFQVVSLLAVAPSVQMLYVIMMYISAYPVALSVRSTNVYEERALGIFEEDDNDSVSDTAVQKDSTSPRMWGTLLAAHARRQLAFDIWWLGFALWIICIIERTNIEDATSNGWFTIFSVLFELTSAYGTVGLSLGTPYDNFSLSGRFSKLSKLVVCAVMLRGRHRGLPVAIDRAVLLPEELEAEDAGDWSVIDPDVDDFLDREDDGFRRRPSASSFTQKDQIGSPKHRFSFTPGRSSEPTEIEMSELKLSEEPAISSDASSQPPRVVLDPASPPTIEPTSHLPAIKETATPVGTLTPNRTSGEATGTSSRGLTPLEEKNSMFPQANKGAATGSGLLTEAQQIKAQTSLVPNDYPTS